MSAFQKFSRYESEYKTENSGTVRFKRDDLQSVQPKYDNTLVVLKNGRAYLLQGRGYGV